MNVRSKIATVTSVFMLLISLLQPLGVSAASSPTFQNQQLILEWAKKEYQGRQTGTPGYAKAVDDLQKRMIMTGLIPAFGESQYRQSYDVGTASLTKQSVSINGKTLKLMQDYMPFSRSASGSFTFKHTYYAGAGSKSDYSTAKVNDLVVFHWYDRQGKFPEGAMDRIQRAVANGAKGVLIIADGELKVGNYEHPLNTNKLGVPVLYITKQAASSLGLKGDFVPTTLNNLDVRVNLTIDRSTQQTDNLVGVIPGKNEQKSILWVTNIDGFGTLPDGRWYENAKSGSAAAAMMLDMARYYRENTPEYTMIFAFVGSKWKDQEGVKALASQLNFDHITYAVDLYAMGGDGDLDKMNINYVDPALATAAITLGARTQLNADQGNALSSILKNKTKNLFLIRDDNTWVDDSFNDKASAISSAQYEAGTRSLLTLSDRIMALPTTDTTAKFDYTKSKATKTTLDAAKVTLNRLESAHFTVYADDNNLGKITPTVLQEMDGIYDRVAWYNYTPAVGQKAIALFMDNGEQAAQIAGRTDLVKNSSSAGGGFANVYDGQMYIYMRNGPYLGTIAHELNHALATVNPYAGDNFELQEWQGQSHFIRYDMSGTQSTYFEKANRSIQSFFLTDHEVPKLRQLVATYQSSLDWDWYTKSKKNPDGHLYTYYVMGSMYAFLNDQYGKEASRRAMYRNYIDVSNIQKNIIADTGLNLDEFLKSWSKWLLDDEKKGSNIETVTNAAASQKGDNGFDYRILYTLPDSQAGFGSSPAPELQTANLPGKPQVGDTIPYNLSLSSKDLSIRSLNVYKTTNGASVEIEYESSKDRFLSLFDPPNGGAIMKFLEKGLPRGTGKATVKLSSAEVKIVSAQPVITMRLGEGEDFAFMAGAELRKVLNENK